ncbi:hypothetical protein BDZ45DRAFT_734722 [Acephala macrosclerotiorum]|nr:hypothetical protein BDZ45DRAFT_734722 [Acephala macrosclerotiorum]
MASAKNSVSEAGHTSKDRPLFSIVVDPLPIRAMVKSTPTRPPPLTASSSSSTTSSTSNSSSPRIFDNNSARPQTPLTPPDESPCIVRRGLRAGNDLGQDTPSLNVRRRPGRPRLTAVQNQNLVTKQRSASLHTAPDHTQSPPSFKQLTLKDAIVPVTRAVAPRPTAIVDDMFVDASPAVITINASQSNSQGPTDLSTSDVNSTEDQPHEQSKDERNQPQQRSKQEPKKDKNMKQGTATLEFVPYLTHRNVRSINESIKMIMAKPKVPTGGPGWTYVLESPDRAPGHLKIGNTMTLNVRDTSWRKCEPGFTLVDDTEDMNGFDLHPIVESLVHQELHNMRRTSLCKRCRKRHDEWFEVKKDDAFKCIRRWRAWIKVQKPYQAYHTAIPDGVDEPKQGKVKSGKTKVITIVKQWKLTPYWQWKVNNLPKIITDVDWDVWTQPSRLDYLDYWFEEHWGGSSGYYFALKRHFNRKDKHFFLVGISMFLFMHIIFGGACSMCTLIGLIAL